MSYVTYMEIMETVLLFENIFYEKYGYFLALCLRTLLYKLFTLIRFVLCCIDNFLFQLEI